MTRPEESRPKRVVGVTLLALGVLGVVWSALDWRYYALAPIGMVLVYAGLRTYPDPRTRRVSRWMLWGYLTLLVGSLLFG